MSMFTPDMFEGSQRAPPDNSPVGSVNVNTSGLNNPYLYSSTGSDRSKTPPQKPLPPAADDNPYVRERNSIGPSGGSAEAADAPEPTSQLDEFRSQYKFGDEDTQAQRPPNFSQAYSYMPPAPQLSLYSQNQFYQQPPQQYQNYYQAGGANAQAQSNPYQVAASFQIDLSSTSNPFLDHEGERAEVGVPLYTSSTANHHRKFIKQGCKDLWAAIVFLLLLTATIIIGVLNFINKFNYISDGTRATYEHLPNSKVVAITSAVCVGAGILLGVIALLMFQHLPRFSIVIANLAFCAYFIAAGVYVICKQGLYAAGAILILIGLLRLFFLWSYRGYIGFSGILLRRGAILSQKYPAMTFVNVLLVILLTVFLILWGSMMEFSLMYLIKGVGHFPAAIYYVVLVLAVIALYWTPQVIHNSAHVAISGVVATWYFCGYDAMPQWPTLYSTKRAFSTSFGSVCFGSLLVTLLQLIRAIIHSAAHSHHENFCVAFIACIAQCFLGCIERLLKLFNKYAYVFCAIYGSSYIDAAKHAFELVKRSPYLIVMNNSMVDTTLNLFSFGCGAVGGVICAVIRWDIPLGVLAFFIIGATTTILFQVVDSAVTAIFVCVAEEPDTMHQTVPQLGAEMSGVRQTVMRLLDKSGNAGRGIDSDDNDDDYVAYQQYTPN